MSNHFSPFNNHVIKTHDIFDTLIARKCIFPASIFTQVEKQSGITGYAAIRVEAERFYEGKSYSLGDIYRRVEQVLGLEHSKAQELMQLEIECEIMNAIPVADEVNRLDSDSVLISDMYLPLEIVRDILRATGIPQDVPVVLSTQGKRSGQVWKQLRSLSLGCIHHGDNEYSDIKQPRLHGMRAYRNVTASITSVEKSIINAGMPATAMLLRTARLQSKSGKLPYWNLNLQCQVNFPVLVAFGVLIVEYCRRNDVKRILFSSRDARNLLALTRCILQKLEINEIQTHYWFSSRLARNSGDENYIEYCRETFGAKFLVVDLCGTGISLAKLASFLNHDQTPRYMVCLHLDSLDISNQARKLHGAIQDWANIEYLMKVSTSINNQILEFLNLISEGMTVGVAKIQDTWIPIRHRAEYDGATLELVKAQQAYLKDLFNHIDADLLAEAYKEVITFGTAQIIHALNENRAELDLHLNYLQREFHDNQTGTDESDVHLFRS